MSLVPKKQVEKVAFFKDKAVPWLAHSTAIGTTSSAVTAMSALVTAAEAALADKNSALTAAKTAIDNADLAIDALAKSGADIISAIRTKARTGGDVVYTLAGLPIPSTPAPKAKPGTPYKFEAILNPDGSLDMKWKCDNHGATGTMYQVYRALNGSMDFQIVGGTGQRQLTDPSIPASATRVTYKIQATRSTSVGLWATFNVFFGSNAGGNDIASIEAVPVKIAA